MKYILTFFAFCCCTYVSAGSKVYEKLTEVNKCWTEQKDVHPGMLPSYTI